MEIALLFIVFAVVFICRYLIVKLIDKGSVSSRTMLTWDVICLILSIGLIVVFGLRFLSLWRDNTDITVQLTVYIIFVIGCIIHFARLITKDIRKPQYFLTIISLSENYGDVFQKENPNTSPLQNRCLS